jgi:acyl carrier protein
MEKLRDRVGRVIAGQFHVADGRITEEASLDEDLGATSRDHVEMVMALEDEFEIEISDDEASRLHTVADVVACVAAGVQKGKATGAGRPL